MKQYFRMYKKHPKAVALRILVTTAAALTVLVLFSLVFYILIKGIPNLKPSLFEWKYTSKNASMMPAIINTITMVLMTLLIAVPFGIGSAIYLTEYAKRGNKVVPVIRMTTETLSGIPSIVYGLFGYMAFVRWLDWGYSLMAGIITLAIMILPLIMRTTEEALLAVPDSYREGSYGLGAGRLRTIFRVVLPSAMPGILSGVILGVGRIVGESAALLFTAGFGLVLNDFVTSLQSSSATLTVALYVYANERGETGVAFAIAAILMILTFAINLSANLVGRKLKK